MKIPHYFGKTDGVLNVHYNHNIQCALNKNATLAQIIGYNRYYLIFSRPLNNILRQQLFHLYNELTRITLTLHYDQILWR
jgi:hypothetical protein